jgi:hypothetical protein
MPPHRADGSAVANFFSTLALVAGTYIAASGTALAADHKISAQAAIFDCSRVSPGDTITLASGLRGPLKISDCKGYASNRIIVRNDPNGNGPVVIRRTTTSPGGFVFNCVSCVGVEIDGSYKWNGAPSGRTYGIKLTTTTGGGPSMFLRIAGLSRFVTIRNVEIDGAWPRLASQGSGISVNDLTVKSSAYPGLWREGILIEDNFIHDVQREGMYIGPNYPEGNLPLRNVEIRYNRVEDTGFEAVSTKSMWTGKNSIHHNVVIRAGTNGKSTDKSSQYSGILNGSGTVDIHHNWIEKTGQHGIRVWTAKGPLISQGRGPFIARIWNNVIVDAGALWRSFMLNSYGISVGADSGLEKPVPYIYSNTVVNSRLSGINLNSNVASGYVRDNIVAGTGSNPAIFVPKFITLVNNAVGSVSQMGFVDPSRRNFRLGFNSPARNQGTSSYPPTDFDDVRRPKEGSSDQGAFEAG